MSNEHFLVWAQNAAFGKFKGLYGRIQLPKNSPEQNITFVITSNFDASLSGSKKFLVISGNSWFGGAKVDFAILYMAVGALCVLLSIAFLVKNNACPRPRLEADLDLLEEILSRKPKVGYVAAQVK